MTDRAVRRFRQYIWRQSSFVLTRTDWECRLLPDVGGAGLGVADVDQRVVEEERRLLLADVGIGARVLVRVTPGRRREVLERDRVAAGVPDDEPRPVARVSD